MSTVHRWHRTGVRGIRLNVVKLADYIATTQDDVLKFLNSLNEPDTPQPMTQAELIAEGILTGRERKR